MARVNFWYEHTRLLSRMAKILSSMLYQAVRGKIILGWVTFPGYVTLPSHGNFTQTSSRGLARIPLPPLRPHHHKASSPPPFKATDPQQPSSSARSFSLPPFVQGFLPTLTSPPLLRGAFDPSALGQRASGSSQYHQLSCKTTHQLIPKYIV